MLRFRSLFLYFGSILLLLVLYLTDPSGNGAQTEYLFLATVISVLGVAFSQVTRKALFDYPESDIQSLLGKAKETSTGAGLSVLGLLIFFGMLVNAFVSKVNL